MGRNFQYVFFTSSHPPMTPMHVVQKSGRQTHTHTDAATLYVWISKFKRNRSFEAKFIPLYGPL